MRTKNMTQKWEVLLRHRENELDCTIEAIISNHTDLKAVADTFYIPFKVFPITSETNLDQEKQEIYLVKKELDVDVLELARYM